MESERQVTGVHDKFTTVGYSLKPTLSVFEPSGSEWDLVLEMIEVLTLKFRPALFCHDFPNSANFESKILAN